MELLPQEVSFEHRIRKAGAVPPSFAKVELGAARLVRSASWKAKIWRWVFVVVGAAIVAFVTQRSGLSLPLALCPFFGVLPVLWVGGWLFGYRLHLVRAAQAGEIEMGSTQWKHELESVLVPERVKIAISREAMIVTRDDVVASAAWKHVQFKRFGVQEIAIFFGPGDAPQAVSVPRTAFTSDAAFDDFCLTMQGFIWEAER